MSTSALSSIASTASDGLTARQRTEAARLTGSALRDASPEMQRAAVAEQFEAIFVRQLIGKTMTQMLGEANSASTSIYGDLMTDAFAKQLTAGSGLGLARLLEQQLTPRTPAHPASGPLR